MKKGLILINAYSQNLSLLNQPLRLKQEFTNLGVECDICRNDGFPVTINADGEIESRVAPYDFCVFFDKDKYLSYLLEKTGLRLFNRAAAIEVCDDKMATHIALSGNGIPMPETVPGLLCYNAEAEISQSTYEFLENKLGYPLIAKASYGSLGNGVFKIDNREQLKDVCEKLKCRSHLFQKFIAESIGRDLRVIVIGGKVVAAMERVSANDFRSNIELGGKGVPFTVPPELEKLCIKVAGVLNLDYCGIDVLEGKEGYLVCEVNSNAFFGGIEKVTKINVAERYASHVINTIYG